MKAEIVVHRSAEEPPQTTKREYLLLFEGFNLRSYLRSVRHGLNQPRGDTEHNWAVFQVYRWIADTASFLVPVVIALLLMFLCTGENDRITEGYTCIIQEPEAPPPDTDPIPETPPETTPELITPIAPDFSSQQTTVRLTEITPPGAPGPSSDNRARSLLSDVQMNRGPVILKTLLGPRGDRLGQLKQHGDGVGIVTEPAVMRALRWLKKEQRADGSWGSPPVAMTALALLCYLGHNEIPESDEFGPTVEKAIKYLLGQQRPDGRFPGNYDIPIATYALCEAFGMTQVPMVRDAAEKALDVIIAGQHSSGGWDYNCQQSERDDTSYMGWCVQALKAGYMARLSNPELKASLGKAVRGFKKNAHPTGGFGYTGPGEGGLTAVGTLCMQLLGAAKESECRRGLVWLDRITFDWKEPWGARPVYYWYYTTQAKFHEGGSTWKQWNNAFALRLADRQTVMEGAGPDGVDIGYWDAPSETEKSLGLIYNTCLCTLMLEVYYRYLPTYQEKAVTEEQPVFVEKDPVPITVIMPNV